MAQVALESLVTIAVEIIFERIVLSIGQRLPNNVPAIDVLTCFPVRGLCLTWVTMVH
jgi:hypothetical protein